MNKLVFTVFAAVGLMLPLSAQPVNVDVPFEFAVGNQMAPAGRYDIRYEAGSPVLHVEGSDSGSRYATRVMATQDVNRAPQPKLVFHRYENQYFLWQVWTGTLKYDLPLSRVERELKSSSVTPPQEVVLAMR